MSSLEVLPPEELLDHARDPEDTETIERDDLEYLDAEAGELSQAWRSHYQEAAKTHNWRELRQSVEDFRASQELLMDQYDDVPQVKDAMARLNYLFGAFPTSFVDTQANIYRERRPEDLGSFIDQIAAGNEAISYSDSALHRSQWMNEANWLLLRFGNRPITEPTFHEDMSGRKMLAEKGKTLAEYLVETMTSVYQRGYPLGMANREIGIEMSGIYGALKMARTAHSAGKRVYLPPASWDAFGGIDLLVTEPDDQTLHAFQIKSSTKPSLRTSNVEIGGKVLSTMDNEDTGKWEDLVRSCNDIATHPNWAGKGIDIIPHWATISNAQGNITGWNQVLSEQPPGADIRTFDQITKRS